MTSRDDGLRVTIMAVTATLAALLAMHVSWAASPAEAAFPGDNGLIVFMSNITSGPGVDNPSGDSEIFAAPPIGDLIQRSHNTSADYSPSWSADGSKIVFIRSSQGGSNDLIDVRDTAGGGDPDGDFADCGDGNDTIERDGPTATSLGDRVIDC